MPRGFMHHIDRLLLDCEKKGLLFAPTTQSAIEACRRRVAQGIVVEPFRGLFARDAYWETVKAAVKPYQIIRTLSYAHPQWVFCSFSAACMHGLSVSTPLLRSVHIAVGPSTHSGTSGRIVRHKIVRSRVRRIFGVPVTSFDETVVDCLRSADFPSALAIADSAVRTHRLTSSSLQNLVERHGTRKQGASRARRCAAYADARSESGGESVARARMIELGFAVPDLQVKLPNVVNRKRSFYVDYYWTLPDGKHIVGEMDGLEKYTMFTGSHAAAMKQQSARQRALAALVRERQRESRLTAVCDGVVRFTYADIMDDERFSSILDAYSIPRVRKPRRPDS